MVNSQMGSTLRALGTIELPVWVDSGRGVSPGRLECWRQAPDPPLAEDLRGGVRGGESATLTMITFVVVEGQVCKALSTKGMHIYVCMGACMYVCIYKYRQ